MNKKSKKMCLNIFFSYLKFLSQIRKKNLEKIKSLIIQWRHCRICTNYAASMCDYIIFFSEKKPRSRDDRKELSKLKSKRDSKSKDRHRDRASTTTDPGGRWELFRGGISIQIQVIWENWRVDNGEWNVFFFEKLFSLRWDRRSSVWLQSGGRWMCSQ